jgi:hypothetical protein
MVKDSGNTEEREREVGSTKGRESIVDEDSSPPTFYCVYCKTRLPDGWKTGMGTCPKCNKTAYSHLAACKTCRQLVECTEIHGATCELCAPDPQLAAQRAKILARVDADLAERAGRDNIRLALVLAPVWLVVYWLLFLFDKFMHPRPPHQWAVSAVGALAALAALVSCLSMGAAVDEYLNLKKRLRPRAAADFLSIAAGFGWAALLAGLTFVPSMRASGISVGAAILFSVALVAVLGAYGAIVAIMLTARRAA